jgi:hypothetical protein
MIEEQEANVFAFLAAFQPSFPKLVINFDFLAIRGVGECANNFLELVVQYAIVFQKLLAFLAHWSMYHTLIVNLHPIPSIG